MAKSLSDVHLDRKEAIALLRELVTCDLVEPSWVSVEERKPNHFQLQIKCDYNKTELEAYAKKHGLTIIDDKERKYLIIFKP